MLSACCLFGYYSVVVVLFFLYFTFLFIIVIHSVFIGSVLCIFFCFVFMICRYNATCRHICLYFTKIVTCFPRLEVFYVLLEIKKMPQSDYYSVITGPVSTASIFYHLAGWVVCWKCCYFCVQTEKYHFSLAFNWDDFPPFNLHFFCFIALFELSFRFSYLNIYFTLLYFYCLCIIYFFIHFNLSFLYHTAFIYVTHLILLLIHK